MRPDNCPTEREATQVLEYGIGGYIQENRDEEDESSGVGDSWVGMQKTRQGGTDMFVCVMRGRNDSGALTFRSYCCRHIFYFFAIEWDEMDEMCVFCSTDEAEMERWRRGSGGGEFLRATMRAAVTPEQTPPNRRTSANRMEYPAVTNHCCTLGALGECILWY